MAISLGSHQEAFSADLMKLLIEAHRLGFGVRIGEVWRTPEQQKIYVDTGRSKTLNSMHIKKCAADLHFTRGGTLVYPEQLGRFWESLSPLNKWGGNWTKFKDLPHFQRTV
jgi:hypothetical protein